MAGEYDVARELIGQAFEQAEKDRAMSTDTMATALLGTLLKRLLSERSPADVASLIDYQIESLGADEFVITRGC